jgi:ribosomal protein L11 methyltransferase
MPATEPWALDIDASPVVAFDLADALGMIGAMEALSVAIFDAKDGQMRVQALYETHALAEAAREQINRPEATIKQLPPTDWVSQTQKGLPPVQAGRFHLYGSHDSETVPEGVVAIHVDAGMAFGTGHHGTTAGCLVIFDDMLNQGLLPAQVLDLGCGAGVLAIAAARTLPETTKIIATDIDPDAIDVTRENAAQNGVETRLTAHVADGFDSHVLKGQTFELIFANILAGPLMGLAANIVAALAPSGHVILSGILDEKAEAVSAHFAGFGLEITPYPSLNGWTSLRAKLPQ